MSSNSGPSSLARMWDWPPPCIYSQPPACTLTQLRGSAATFCCLGPSCYILVSATRLHMGHLGGSALQLLVSEAQVSKKSGQDSLLSCSLL